ncbi:hypothetical protein [Psychrobacter sp. FDAARGOS_221]|uniref:hypothetical protein n=1 Tax=Psychrobacter sp. FDAARGOS_221 TaxID=1975705 RepID=UPI000BB52CB4|nr:hypothetical protein [Psychrobacter sp. FDAARGOS_221]PNK59694.1 hypothetical protein A6J60_001545 [Psychrobacter sp. FDAARGOS_221]
MQNNNPQLDRQRQQQLIQQYLQKLIKTDPTLYYSATTDIARALYPMIKENLQRMPVEDQALLRNLSARDIEMLLSFHH